MAVPSVCRSCARASRVSRTLIKRQIHHAAQRGSFHTAPLYLEFLAPSWPLALRHQSSSVPRSSTDFARPRTFSQTAYSRSDGVSTASVTTANPEASSTISILNPRQTSSGEQMAISITPRAAIRLQAIAEKDSNPDLALRVSVESGGCHGFQYLMSLVNVSTDVDRDAEEGDTVFESLRREKTKEQGESGGSEYKAKVVMDEPSLQLLNGSRIDYTMELIGSQFKVVGIPGAKSSCGCGTSFDIS